VVRALKGIGRPVVFIGDPVPAYQDYYEACRREAGAQMHFLGGLPHGSELLVSAYAACNTFLLATWLETPGLAALEAGLAGAKVVITDQGATQEYFGDHVLYVRPDRPDSIRSQTMKMLSAPRTDRLKKHIQANYLWPQAARQNLEVYEQVLVGKVLHEQTA
ncbi:MAG TPA: glycosyltransferase, partial [Verrucomicrobiae bacterium]|nr:glycosyltransferase [Verrucomicrobiae bacterium]